NIQLNQLNAKVIAFPLAISDRCSFDTLRLNTFEAGAAHHVFARNIDFKGERFEPQFEQGAIAMTLDEVVAFLEPDFPSVIKVDVDGLEAEILRGGRKILMDRRLTGLLVELNDASEETKDLLALLEDAGLRPVRTGETVADAA